MNWQETIKLKEIQELAKEFFLPCVTRKDEVTIIGEKYLIIFKRQENTCQLHKII